MVRDAVGWEEVAPAGGEVHVAWFDGQGLHAIDVWESEEAFQTFFAQRLAPAIEKAGFEGAPDTYFNPLNRRFVSPGITGAAGESRESSPGRWQPPRRLARAARPRRDCVVLPGYSPRDRRAHRGSDRSPPG
ncbi:hypothetical protein [Streptomyces sp. NRRL WC-3618]|uniref:hypothetical protein n=1 Tax=Streptomyces sp. NRRL WC-3618 TaxID=1519490 RepID=UPI0007C757EB|nr:hypothetical protein [Streptomyces sp. NRRL WC-3618]